MSGSMLADLLRQYAGQGDDSMSGTSDRGAYLDYCQACMEAGTKPLAYPEWINAGKPKG